jgi:uncharacterized membrane protein YjfL (UPF0719 family)
MKLDGLGEALVTSAAFAALGIAVFALAFWLFRKVLPFSLRKEIEEDQNTSLGIIMGSVIIGISLIIAAAVHG